MLFIRKKSNLVPLQVPRLDETGYTRVTYLGHLVVNVDAGADLPQLDSLRYLLHVHPVPLDPYCTDDGVHAYADVLAVKRLENVLGRLPVFRGNEHQLIQGDADSHARGNGGVRLALDGLERLSEMKENHE